jgi:histidine triad (HIT) family protein
LGLVTDDCLFCDIVAGRIPADVVTRTDRVLAFRDIAPAAPTHVLVIPVEHHRDLAGLVASDPSLAADVLAIAAQVGADLDGGYRVVFNTGADGGQAVFHVHAHVLGGRQLAWPPG